MTCYKLSADIFILLLGAAVFLRRIGAFPLRNWDEAWYGEIIKNMASGRYGFLMPYWNGRFYFDHEPLYFWLSAPIVKVFGSGEWQVRVISAVSGVFATYLVFLIGKKLTGALVGIFSTLIFLTLGGVVIRFAHGNLDSLLTCLFLATFYFFIKGQEKFYFTILSGICLGLGILVKSWGIGLFPFFLILSYGLFIHGKFEIRRYLTIIVCAFCIAIPWYIWGLFTYGKQFENWFLFNPSEGRLASPLANFTWDYFIFAVRDVGLWAIVPVILISIKLRIPKIFLTKNYVWPFLFVSGIYIFFLNFLSDKSDWYLIPAYPLIALVLGFVSFKLFLLNKRAFGFLFIIVLLVQYFNLIRIENIYPDRSKVGAILGLRAQTTIPIEDEVILDDHDFTAFLYYSNQNHVYTFGENRKEGEWWILKSDEFSSFVNRNPITWIVTRNPDRFPMLTTVDKLEGYSFMRTY